MKLIIHNSTPWKHIRDEIREKWVRQRSFYGLDAAEDRLVEALVAWENDKESVAATTGCDWIFIGRETAIGYQW